MNNQGDKIRLKSETGMTVDILVNELVKTADDDRVISVEFIAEEPPEEFHG